MASPLLDAPPPITVASFSRLSSSHSETLGVSLSYFTQQLPLSASSSSTSIPLGDRKTAEGKRFNDSFGNARSQNKNKGRGLKRVSFPPAPHKFENDEKIITDIDKSRFSN